MVKVEDGYHYDQKWVDLAISFYHHVHVLRDQAYNIAYWNLHERGNLIELKQDGYYYINKQTRHTKIKRVVFFHFSGLELENLRYSPYKIVEELILISSTVQYQSIKIGTH